MDRRQFLTLMGGAPLLAGCVPVVGADYYYDDYPPEAFIATAAPVYYGGYPYYWYHERWYRRDARGWRGYREEPSYLRSYRTRAPAPGPRTYYGRGHYTYRGRRR